MLRGAPDEEARAAAERAGEGGCRHRHLMKIWSYDQPAVCSVFNAPSSSARPGPRRAPGSRPARAKALYYTACMRQSWSMRDESKRARHLDGVCKKQSNSASANC
jgi:hypothetical protein